MNNIIALNNRAIGCLRRQQHEDDAKKAVAYLYQALQRLRKEFHQKDTKLSSARVSESCNRFSRRPIIRRRNRPGASLSSNSQRQQHEDSVVICKIPITKKQQKQQRKPQLSASPSEESNENLFSLYQQAFIISPITSGTRKCNTQVYIVLLYNIGLALHLQAGNNKSILLNAQKFYELAMSMIAIEWKDMDSDDLLLMLAISNNLGHIHSNLLNFSETQKFLTWLRNVTKAYQQHHDRGSALSDQDHSFFFANSLFLEDFQQLSCAPMA